MRIGAIFIMTLLFIGFLIPIGFSNESDLVVVTYGETTQENLECKHMVNEYFKNNAHVNVENSNNKILTAKNINDFFGSFSDKFYPKDEIYLSSLLDLNKGDELIVTVDESKITAISSEMLKSALMSAGISKGHVYVTSPIETTGDFAMANVFYSYESATNVEIPVNIKKAASFEVQTQAGIVDNSNITAKDLSNLVSGVKGKVIEENITDHTKIVNLINKENNETKLNLTNNDIEKLANAIGEVQSVQKNSNEFKNHISGFLDGHCKSKYSIENVLNGTNSLFKR